MKEQAPTRDEISRNLRDKRSQKFMTLRGQRFVADKQMIPLLRAMSAVGLKTESHCGHRPDKFVRFNMSNITGVEICTVEGVRSLVIQWRKTDCRLAL